MKIETRFTEADEGDSNSRCDKDLTEEYKDNAKPNPQMKDKKDGGELVCYKCLHGGTLVCCCAKGCRRRYHPSCLDPPLNYVPMGFWHCLWCAKKKLDLGVHSISEGVEAILDSRKVVSENNVMEREYFVKYQGLAHAHNCWILESQMLLEVPKLLAKFKRKNKVSSRWKKEWSIPHRLLLKREIVLPKQSDKSIDRYEWLVKWTGLGYDHVTWELDDASFMTSSEGMKLIKDYKSRQKRTDRLSEPFEANKERKAPFTELSVLPSDDSSGFYNQHLSYVNKLRFCWHNGRSALIVDDKNDQERIMKVILFILSMHCKVTRPFLIISTSTALSVWEREFLHLAPTANLVVYKGNKNVRSIIRALEFSNGDGGVLFQILLSSSDIVNEDVDKLRCNAWEAIIIDECQRYKTLEHLDNIKILTAEMRLLLVSGQIKEDRADYIKLLSFLKCGDHGSNIAQSEAYFSDSISNLKSHLEQYVAFKCNTWSARFAEFWVPAQLSSLQLEQYCSLLLSNSISLCSAQKSTSVDALHNLIISTRKCCNHPNLLDQSLHNFVNKGLSVEEHLNIGIKASGKLQLLEKFLLEARSRGLRVVILFQSTGGLKTIGDILDDVLCQRFGKDCYVRYARGYIPSKKQDALDAFNDRESGKFVFLIESRACLPSVKLSSVDTVILFDSDWDPQNDLRALQKMSISSQFEQLTVFRLYSSFTIEEKSLMVAREGKTLDSDIQLISQSSCHTLLKWGASYLFNKLDDLHGRSTSVSASDISSDQSLLSHVISELSTQLVCGSGDTDHGWSFIARVQQTGGAYARNILLLGERDMHKLDNCLDGFSWSNLLKERNPLWKFLSVSTQRIRKAVNNCDQIVKESECENDAITGKRRKVPEDNVNTKRRKVSKDNVVPKRRKVSKGSDDAKSRTVSKDIVDSKDLKISLKNKKLKTVSRTSIMTGKTDDLSKKSQKCLNPCNKKKLANIPKNTELLPKPDLAGLCHVLKLPKKVKAVATKILEHIFECYDVNCQEVSTMQAFQISVCWLASCILKHKIDKHSSFALAKVYLNFDCKEEEVNYVYSTLQERKKSFSSYLKDGLSVEKCTSDRKTPELYELEEMQNDFWGPHVSDLVDSDTNDHERESPTTVLSTHDQTYTENFHNRPTADESCPSQKISGSLPVEANTIPMESNAEDDRMNYMTSIPAEVSFIEHQEYVNSMNMPIHHVQLHSVETNTVTCNPGPVLEVSQCYRVPSPVRGESTNSDFSETMLPYMQRSNENLQPFAQDAMPAVPSCLENSSIGEALPLDEYFCHLSNFHVPEVIFPDSNDPVEQDPLQIEMERITKVTEEASNIREQKMLQFKFDYEKEAEMLHEKYKMLLQNVDDAVAIKKRELDTYYEIVQKNDLLAELWFKYHGDCKDLAIQCSEQVTEMSKLTCVLYYGGVLQHEPSMRYVGGVCEELREFDVNYLFVTHLRSHVKSSGYSEPERFLYKFKDDKDENMNELFIDKDVLNIVQALHSNKKSVLEIYALHSVYEGDEGVINLVVEGGDDVVSSLLVDGGVDEVSNSVIDGGVEGGSDTMVDEGDDIEKNVNEVGDLEVDNDGNGKRKGKGSTKGKEKTMDDDDDVDDRLEECDFADSENEGKDLFFEDNDRLVFEEVRMIQVSTPENGSINRACEGGTSMGQSSNSSVDIRPQWDGECESKYEDSDTLLTPDASDEKGGKHQKKYPEFNQFVDMKREIDLKLGMKFANYKVFREALRQYCIVHGIDCVFVKNELRRITVHCKRMCGWRMHASINKKENCFQIKTWNNSEHIDCGWSNHNTKENAREYKMLVSGFQYHMLWNYCAAVGLYNPGSTTKLQLKNHKFERLYACLDAIKSGMKFCRPIIHLDRCFLNAGFGGQLLVAVARDGNDDIFPVAYAAVQAETRDSWHWFINLLLDDIGSSTEHCWVFMSNMQKGLKDVIESLGFEHRFCVRHLYENFKLTYGEQTLKDLMWNAARATTTSEFAFQIEHISKIDEGAARWLIEKDPTTWSRHKFSPYTKCGALQNNITKSFNAAILYAIDKPIITMMETIRRMLMKRFAAKKEGIMKYNGVICPRIQAKLEKAKEDAVLCTPHMNGAGKFEVDTFAGSKRVVDLVAGTCSCRIWDLTGIPCAHAISAIYEQKEVPENYVSHYYKKETFMSTYEVMINPMPSADEWPQIVNDPIKPPAARVQVATPKKPPRGSVLALPIQPQQNQ